MNSTNGRIFIYNPQTSLFFGKTFNGLITRSKLTGKYSYLKELIRERRIFIFNDNKSYSLAFTFISRVKWLHNFFNWFEIYIWLLINSLSIRKTKIVRGFNSLNENDILILLAHENIDNSNIYAERIIEAPCYKLFFFTHYFFNTSLISSSLGSKSNYHIISENNLKKNSLYFNFIFTNYKKDVYTLPFVVSSKFASYRQFDTRISKCLAIGTMQYFTKDDVNLKDFISYFNIDTFHPIRKYIYENKEYLKTHIDSYISCINDDLNIKKMNFYHETSSSNIFRKVKIYYDLLFKSNYTSRAYYDFDIVKLYNDYKMFICPEEACDLPGIGFVEGMACGCLFFGKLSSIYTDLGLIDGTHYVAYDGTVEDLIRKIDYYLLNENLSKTIAESGKEFVINNFNSDNVKKLFYQDLSKLQVSIANTSNYKNVKFQSSFIKVNY